VNADSQPLYRESAFSGASQGQTGGSPITGESMYSGSGAMGGMQAPSIGSSAFIGGFQAPSIVSAINTTSQEPLASPSSASGGQSASQLLMAEARQTLPDYATIPPSSRTGSPLTQMTFDVRVFVILVVLSVLMCPIFTRPDTEFHIRGSRVVQRSSILARRPFPTTSLGV
jgi:hypothetical protein